MSRSTGNSSKIVSGTRRSARGKAANPNLRFSRTLTTSTVWPPAMPLSSSEVCMVSASAMPAAGSSTSRSFGSCASSMPISDHCFCPWLRSAARSSRLADRWTVARMSSMRSRSAALGRANSVARTPRPPASDSSRLSKTLCVSKTVGRWNLRPTPGCACPALSRVCQARLSLSACPRHAALGPRARGGQHRRPPCPGRQPLPLRRDEPGAGLRPRRRPGPQARHPRRHRHPLRARPDHARCA